MTAQSVIPHEEETAFVMITDIGNGDIALTINSFGQEVRVRRLAKGRVGPTDECYAVRVLNLKTDAPQPSGQDILEQGIDADESWQWHEDGEWRASDIPTGYCDPGVQNNITWVAAKFADREDDDERGILKDETSVFEGTCGPPTPIPITPPPPPPPLPVTGRDSCCDCVVESAATLAYNALGEPAIPAEFEDGWIRYSHLDVRRKSWGSRLVLGSGRGLRGRIIAIAATNVLWRPDASTSSPIRSPLGNLQPAPEGWEWGFPGLPQYSLVLRQQSSQTPKHLVMSDRRDMPTIVEVDPNEDLFVVVNGATLWPMRLLYRGGYDVWVKIVA